ncbi:hypothetical protein [Breznakia pachnodae]|uniref:Uncharacterized protein n=1 Tax=Breznakia pachnodae TaxID=265178 RepID=A0ABU0E8L6_9FIRM|nr:hypothetical protein [Breznakia pachnodae]MDQ0363234.1 hypothetical protein [Breznakia pachnodae]
MMVYLHKGKTKEIRNIKNIVIKNGKIVFTLLNEKVIKIERYKIIGIQSDLIEEEHTYMDILSM